MARLADFVLVGHLVFVVFAVLGGVLVFRWRRIAWLHIPAVVWSALVEFAGWVCPLTPLENWLRAEHGSGVYHTGFVERYILPIIYPAELTRELQIVLGGLVLLINFGVYGWIIYRARRSVEQMS